MKTKELMDDKIIKNWFSGIKATNSTKKSPIELIEEAEAEIKAVLLMRERSITTYMMELGRD